MALVFSKPFLARRGYITQNEIYDTKWNQCSIIPTIVIFPYTPYRHT